MFRVVNFSFPNFVRTTNNNFKMMNKIVFAAVAIAGVAMADYKDYDYQDYNDYDSSSSSSVEPVPVKFPAGDYQLCTLGGKLTSKRCLAVKETPPPKADSSSSSSSCGGKASSDDVEDPYVEADKYRYVYGSKTNASVFTLSYPNDTTTAFSLSCKNCANEFHGSDIAMVRRHLEFFQTGSAYKQEAALFEAYEFKGKNSVYYKVQSVEDVNPIGNWWQLSTFRKRVEVGMKPRAMKLQFYPTYTAEDKLAEDAAPITV